MTARAGLLGALLATALLAGPGQAQPPVPPTITAVEIDSPHRLDDARVRDALGDLVGHPRRHDILRGRVDRLHALGIFSVVRVEERTTMGGVVLRFVLERAPHVRDVHLQGALGLPEVDLIEAVGLAPGQHLTSARLDRARADLIARYRGEGFLGAVVQVQTVVDETTNGRTITFLIQAGEPARIGSVTVRGLAGEPAEAAREAAGLRPGRRYGERVAREAGEAAESRLRREGYPEARVRVTTGGGRADDNEVDVVLEIVPGSRLRVELAGRQQLAEAEARARLTFSLTGAIDEAEVDASARSLVAAYRERGYAFAEVSGRLRREGEELVVRFEIVEGPRVTVEAIDFTGDVPVPAGRLRARMEIQPRGLSARGLFREETLAADVQALARFLHDEGYPDAQVGPPDVVFTHDRTTARIAIPVAAGPRVTVASLSIDGRPILSGAAARAAVPLTPGGPWSRARAEEGRRLLARLYAQRGFHGAAIEVRTERRGDTVHVTYRVDEGQSTRIGRILIRGLAGTREAVVRRELPFRAGDLLNPEALLEAQRRLVALGLFERVEVEPLRPSPSPFADVHITVREGKPWHVAFGLGYSTFEGARSFVEAGHDNLLGTGRSVALRLRASERGDREEMTYREPWLLGTPWHADATLFRERREEIGFELEQLGVSLGAQRPLDSWLRGLRGALRYELAFVDRFDVDPTLVDDADVQRGRETVATVTPELSLERRDRPMDPARGSFHLVSLRTASQALGSEPEFLRARLETHWFFDWLSPTVVALSARLGLATPLGASLDLPIEERFFAGGATTVRGYRERRLGPLDERGNPLGGNGLFILNAEWRFPLWRWLGGSVFFDTGMVTSEVGDLEPAALRSGTGAGLRVSTPVGPIRLDVGYPLNSVERQEQTWRFYLTIGHPF